MDLTPKQALFVKEYLVDLNATQAAIRAGYSEKTAKEIGCENLTKPNIKRAIDEAMDARAKRIEVDEDYVIETIMDTIQRCMDEDNYQPNYVLKGAELLGKHLKMFTEKVEHTGKDGGPIETKEVSAIEKARAVANLLEEGARQLNATVH